MKKILLVLVMIAASVFLAQPAVAEEDPVATTAADTETTSEPQEAAEPQPEEPPEAPPEEPEPQAPAPPAEEGADAPDPDDTGSPAENQSPNVDRPDERTAGNAPPVDKGAVAAAAVKVTICHATSSETNPYIENSPNVKGILDGHDEHIGGIFPTPGWGDIIPPFDNEDGSYAGMNWTPEGQAIFNNGCNIPGEDPEPLIEATAVAPTVTSPTCTADGALVLPVTEGVVYESTPDGTGPGDYTVTASAAVGYELTNPEFQEDITVLPMLTGPQCVIVAADQPTTAGASVTPATCSADGQLVLENTDKVNYLVIPVFGDTVFILAGAKEGYFLTNPFFFALLEIPQELTGPQCDSTDITICHRTNSNVNPYVAIGPDTAGVAHGHDTEHEGPLWNPTLKAQGIEWGDIIPPYTYQDVDYPGQNWDGPGQAFYNNGLCDGAGIEPTEVTPEPPTADPATCEDDGQLNVPETEGVVYTVAPEFSGPGDYVVTATPVNEEVVLVGQTEFEISVDAQLPEAECIEPEELDDPDPKAKEDELLPDTGGLPLWVLLLAGPMTAAGLLILMRRAPVDQASTSGSRPTYSLILPPSKKPAGITRVHASTEQIGFMKAVGNVVAAIGSFFRGGRR